MNETPLTKQQASAADSLSRPLLPSSLSKFWETISSRSPQTERGGGCESATGKACNFLILILQDNPSLSVSDSHIGGKVDGEAAGHHTHTHTHTHCTEDRGMKLHKGKGYR